MQTVFQWKRQVKRFMLIKFSGRSEISASYLGYEEAEL